MPPRHPQREVSPSTGRLYQQFSDAHIHKQPALFRVDKGPPPNENRIQYTRPCQHFPPRAICERWLPARLGGESRRHSVRTRHEHLSATTLGGTSMRVRTTVLLATCFLAVLGVTSPASSENPEGPDKNPPRKIGGFLCVDLKPYRNDTTFDLYQIGWWSYSGILLGYLETAMAFRFGIRKGWAIFSWPENIGARRAAAKSLRPNPAASPAPTANSPATATIAFANDNNLSTYWYAGDNRPHGKLTIDLAQSRADFLRALLWFRNGPPCAEGLSRRPDSARRQREGNRFC